MSTNEKWLIAAYFFVFAIVPSIIITYVIDPKYGIFLGKEPTLIRKPIMVKSLITGKPVEHPNYPARYKDCRYDNKHFLLMLAFIAILSGIVLICLRFAHRKRTNYKAETP